MSDIARLKELAEKATPGPWEIAPDWPKGFVRETTKLQNVLEVRGTPEVRERDAAYITAANPQAILALIADHQNRVSELQAENALAIAHRNQTIRELADLMDRYVQLEAKLATAQNDAYEKAAQVCDREYKDRRARERNVLNNGGGGMGLEIMHSNKAECARVIADRIRALKTPNPTGEGA